MTDNLDRHRIYDRMAHAFVGRMTNGISPAALALATADWWLHLAVSPGKQTSLMRHGTNCALELARDTVNALMTPDAPSSFEPEMGDYRFREPGWKTQPYRAWASGFLLTQQWWSDATRDVPGVSPHHSDVLSFVARQCLDSVSPANFPLTNPAVVTRTVETGGMNLVEGWRNFVDDARMAITGELAPHADKFRVGKDVAATPGKVIFRNELMELIQYLPATGDVYAEPVLIIPAWIMKFYILDLSPSNSLVRYLVEKGHTVFCISWRNVTAAQRDMGFDDYRKLGIMAALDAIRAIEPRRKVHAVGYCLGGTLLAMTSAIMARAGNDRLASVTLLAAQTDFTEPGEMQLFIDHSEVDLLRSMMWQRGYLDSRQMANAFQLLRSNDLIWSRLAHNYLSGTHSDMTDLMAWNADATRLPYKMHSEYLGQLFLDNALASGHLVADGHSVILQNIRAPMFVVGTERDHVAPWKSVYKIHYLVDTHIDFLLTSGGHNAGIISEPGHPRRHFRTSSAEPNAVCHSADEWLAATPVEEGSWWPHWQRWLATHSSHNRISPPPLGAPHRGYEAICEAPGEYVMER